MRARSLVGIWIVFDALSGCGGSPSDDPNAYEVDPSVSYAIEVSEPRWIVPSSALPAEVTPYASNNNVDIVHHDGTLFMAFRTSETHFASPNTRMYILSSEDEGETWSLEQTIAIGADVREPRFLSFKGSLQFFYFEAGVDKYAFEPKSSWRIRRGEGGRWSEAEEIGEPGEVIWNVKVRNGAAFQTSYLGNHSTLEASAIDVRFQKSEDGENWGPVSDRGPVVYQGGASEAAFEFDEDGNLFAVTRIEDGDATGFGSHLCSASKDDLAYWTCPSRTDPQRYDSPQMFRHGDDLYLIARRDIGGPYDQGLDSLDFDERRTQYLLDYWARPKRTAIYSIARDAARVVHILDLPSAGDTAFPSILRTGDHTFLIANYTSPLNDPDRSWVQGQEAEDGTRIYLMTLTFTAE